MQKVSATRGSRCKSCQGLHPRPRKGSTGSSTTRPAGGRRPRSGAQHRTTTQPSNSHPFTRGRPDGRGGCRPDGRTGGRPGAGARRPRSGRVTGPGLRHRPGWQAARGGGLRPPGGGTTDVARVGGAGGRGGGAGQAMGAGPGGLQPPGTMAHPCGCHPAPGYLPRGAPSTASRSRSRRSGKQRQAGRPPPPGAGNSPPPGRPAGTGPGAAEQRGAAGHGAGDGRGHRTRRRAGGGRALPVRGAGRIQRPVRRRIEAAPGRHSTGETGSARSSESGRDSGAECGGGRTGFRRPNTTGPDRETGQGIAWIAGAVPAGRSGRKSGKSERRNPGAFRRPPERVRQAE